MIRLIAHGKIHSDGDQTVSRVIHCLKAGIQLPQLLLVTKGVRQFFLVSFAILCIARSNTLLCWRINI